LAKRPFLSHSLRKFCQICLFRELDHLVSTSFDFATVIFLQCEVVSLASNTQSGGPGLCIYVPQWQGGPVIPPGTGFPFRRVLRLAGLRWRYSNLPPRGIYLLLNQLTSWSWALLEKPTVVQLLKNPPIFYGTRKFITVFTRALHWSLSCARSIQSTPSYPISLRSILISTYVLVFLVVSFLLAFPPKSYMHSCYMAFLSHLHWHDGNYTWRRIQVMKFPIVQPWREISHRKIKHSIVKMLKSCDGSVKSE
jgi:hypothetical protein